MSVARWAEAWARWWAEDKAVPGRLGRMMAYHHVACMMLGLAQNSTYKSVRHEIYVLGRDRGILPWEDPEAAEREREARCPTS